MFPQDIHGLPYTTLHLMTVQPAHTALYQPIYQSNHHSPAAYNNQQIAQFIVSNAVEQFPELVEEIPAITSGKNNELMAQVPKAPITFTDMYNRVSEVRGITIADYYDPSGTLNIQLDVVDDYNVLSNFVLFFFEESEQEAGTLKRQVGSFALSETSNTQTIDLNEQECYFNPDVEYTWTLTYSDARFGSQEMTGSKTITPKYEFYSAEMYSPLQTVGEEYYALVSLGFVDNVNAIDAVTLRLMSTEYDNDYNPILSRDVTLVKKSGYQYVNITSFLNDWHEIIDGGAIHDSGTSTGLPRRPPRGGGN